MTRAPVVLRYALGLGSLCLLLISLSAGAEIALAVQIGIDGVAVPDRFAPIRVSVSGYREPAPSTLVVRQPIGNEWRGTASVSHALDLAIQGDGLYETTLPVYDPINPIQIALVAESGTLLAETELDLRESMRAMPYPLLCKTLPYIPIDAEVADMSSLPDQWAAYDGLTSLWVAAPPSGPSWDAIARWIVSGGTLVVFTGPDYFRLDSPVVRSLLPITNPLPEERADGIWFLSGDLRPGARVLESLAGAPLMISGRVGAGNVILVTVQAHALTTEQLARIAEITPEAAPISLHETTRSSLMQTGITGPSNLSVLVILGSLVVLTIAVSLIGRRRPRLGWILFGCLTLGVSVSAGFMSNSTNEVIGLYCINTHLHLETAYGTHMVYSGLYISDTATIDWDTPAPFQSLEVLPRSLHEAGERSGIWTTEKAVLDGTAGSIRSFHAYGTSAASFSVEWMGGSVRVDDFSQGSFDEVWILRDGRVYPIPDYQGGSRTYTLPSEGETISSFTMGTREPTRLIREISGAFELRHGIWLIAYDPGSERLLEGVERGQKVRDIKLYLVEGRGADEA